MTKKIIGTSKLVELPIGKFASVNGSIVYRFEPYNTNLPWYTDPATGIFIVEVHNHLPMIDAYNGYEPEKDPGTFGYYCDPIDKPEKKHVDNAICMLKKAMAKKEINGLTYVDNYVTLKEYLKPICPVS